MAEVSNLSKEERKQQQIEKRLREKRERGRKAAAGMTDYLSWVRKHGKLDPKANKEEWEETVEEIKKSNADRFKDILDYKDDDELVENYFENRVRVKQAADMCEYIMNLSEEERIKRGFTKEEIEKMRDWKNEYDNLGMFLDCKMIVIQNKNYADPEKAAYARKAKNTELLAAINEKGISREDKMYYNAVLNLRFLKENGISHVPQEHTKSYWSDTTKDGDVKTKQSLFSFTYKTSFEDASMDSSSTMYKYEKNMGKEGKGGFKEFSPDLSIGKYIEGSAHIYNYNKSVKKWDDKISGSVNVDVGKLTVKGGASLSLIPKDGLVPTVGLDVSATFNALSFSAKGKIGVDDLNISGDAKLDVGVASANAGVGLGKIKYKRDDGKEVEGYGVKAEAGAEVAAVKGTVKTGFSIFGIKIGVKVTGTAASIGATASAMTVGTYAEAGISGALGFGVGIKVSVDWSGLKDKLVGWYNRFTRRREMRADESLVAEATANNLDHMSSKEIEIMGKEYSNRKKEADMNKERAELKETGDEAKKEDKQTERERTADERRLKRMQRLEGINPGRRAKEAGDAPSKKSGFSL